MKNTFIFTFLLFLSSNCFCLGDGWFGDGRSVLPSGASVSGSTLTVTGLVASTASITSLQLPSVTAGSILFGQGASPVTGSGVLTNGQLLIGDGSGDPTVAALTGTSNQVTVTNGAGSITLSTPQDLATTSTLQFGKLGLGISADGDHVISENTIQSIVSNHLQNEYHLEGTGTGAKEINGAVIEAVYNDAGDTHSAALNGVFGLFEVANGTQSGEITGIQSYGYAGVAAGATISSNTYMFRQTTLDLAGGGTSSSPIFGMFHSPFASTAFTGPKYYNYVLFGGTGEAAWLSRGGYSIWNDNQSASSFTVRGATAGSLLYVDGANDKIGVNQGAPQTTLHLSSGIFTQDGSTAYHTFNMNTSTPTTVVHQASLWSINVAGQAELKVKDGGGTITQISPHDPTTGKWWFDSYNDRTGKHVTVPDMEKVIRLVEELTGEKLMIVTYEKLKRRKK